MATLFLSPVSHQKNNGPINVLINTGMLLAEKKKKKMLSFSTRLGSRAIRRVPRVLSAPFSDSHDDFKPKKKAVELGDSEIQTLIGEFVEKNKVLLFMKGTPAAPQCGFSQQVVRVLHAVGVDFSSINVLENPEIREGVKKFSDWPTIPQLYVAGEFVGGCDIITAQFQSGELKELLLEHNLLAEK